ncbi:MAG: pyridoxamine 5'-phosphate oxidase family protein [Verrucomicrobia bacterium]|nr:pyridoxamine 5'-phosphate oxidase family protein [Verrucomicrobiota bacterium]
MNTTTATAGTDGECEETDLAKQIRRLVRGQPYGVLCTQGDSQPYGSLVALAATDDLSALLFSTPITTRKYRLLSACDHVAVVIDSRSGAPDELMQVEAVTATGRVHVVPRGPDFERWAGLLIGRHPHLAAFVRAESSALFRVEVLCYFHVSHFQEVRQWIPKHTS